MKYNLLKKHIHIIKKIVLAILSIGISFFISAEYAYASPVSESKIIELVNHERTSRGIQPLVIDSQLYYAASLKAKDMLDKGYFDHFSPDGKSPWYFIKSAKYNYIKAGENLAMDFKTSEGANRAWMNSPTHKSNMLDENYEHIGVSVISGNFNGHETSIVVEMFGKKKDNQNYMNEFIANISDFIIGIR